MGRLTGWVGSDWVDNFFSIFSELGRVVGRKNTKNSIKLIVAYIMFVICIKLYVLWISSSVRLSSCEIMCLSRLLRARRFGVGCNMEFDWVMGWVGLWVQSVHFAMGRVGLKKLDV